MTRKYPNAAIQAGVLGAILGLAATAGVVRAQTYTDLHDFGGIITLSNGTLGQDGIFPDQNWGVTGGGVTFDTAGNMFGTAGGGGLYDNGIVWELTAASGYTDYIDLHDFGGTVINADGVSGPDGKYPDAPITFDSAGNMYGTAWGGGPGSGYSPGPGMVWELTASSGYTVYKDLHDFGETVILTNGQPGTDGALPVSSVTIDSSGDLFGTANSGGLFKHGAGQGMLWEITSGGTYIDLHDFGGPITLSNGGSGFDGTYPSSGVTLDSNGDLYGTTPQGGQEGGFGGIVWELTKSGVYKDLHDFDVGTITDSDGLPGPDGYNPAAGVTLDGSGNLYGTTEFWGDFTQPTGGIIWKLTPSGVYSDLHDFGGTLTVPGGTAPDGGCPIAGVTFDSSGDLFGTTFQGGNTSTAHVYGLGVIWELTSTGSYQILHDFGATATTPGGQTVPDGLSPEAGVTVGSNGTLYGLGDSPYANNTNAPVNPGGGANGDGMLWSLVVGIAPPTIYPAAGQYVTQVTVSISDTSPGTTIYYTTDGSTPAVGVGTTQAYAGSFTLTSSATVNAIAVTAGGASSAVSTSAYVIVPVALQSITVTPHSLTGGAGATATINMTGIVPAGGAVVTLSTDNAAATFTTTTVTVPAGATSTTAQITTVPVSANVLVSLIARYNGVMHNTHLTVLAPEVSSLSVLPSKFTGGTSTTATVKLTGITAVDTTITVTSSNGAASIVGPVVVPAGSSETTFTIDSIPVAVDTLATITASLNGGAADVTVTVRAPVLSGIAFSPKTIGTGQHSTLTATLSTPAPSGGISIGVAYVNGAALDNPPTSIVVPAGATTGSISVLGAAVGGSTTVTATATLAATNKSAVLTVNP